MKLLFASGLLLAVVAALLIGCGNAQAQSLSDYNGSLQLEYSFNNTDLSGSDPLDLSGNGSTGSNVASIVTGAKAIPGTGEAFQITGITTQYLDSKKSLSSLGLNSNKNFTIAWLGQTITTNNGYFLWFGGTDAASGGRFGLVGTASANVFNYVGEGTGDVNTCPVATIQQGELVTTTGTSTTITVYSNTTSVCTGTPTIDRGDEFNLSVGANYVGVGIVSHTQNITHFCAFSQALPASVLDDLKGNLTNGGTCKGTGGGGGSPPPAASTTSLTINSFDIWDATAVSNFSVNVSNSTHTFYNATTSGSVSFGTLANISTYTINISSNFSGGYYNFSRQVTTNGTSTFIANLTQAYITFNASQELYSGRIILGDLNVTIGNQSKIITCSADLFVPPEGPHAVCTNQTFYVKANANITVRTNVSGYTGSFAGSQYFNYTTTVNATALTNTTMNAFFHNAVVNVTLYNKLTNGTITTWQINITPSNMTASPYIGSPAISPYSTGTATSSVVEVPIIKGFNYTFQGSKQSFDVTPRNFSINSRFGNFSLFAQQTFTFNIEVFSESLNVLFNSTPELNNILVTIEVIGPFTQNYTTLNGTLFVPNLTAGEYELRYSAPTFRKRSYFVTLPANGSADIDLFLLNDTLGTQVVLTVVDENDDPLNASIVKILRFYTAQNSFKTVEMSRSNFNGEAPVFVVLNTQEYRFLVEKDGAVIFFSGETKITATTLTIQIVVASDPFEIVKGLSGVYATLSSASSAGGANSSFTYTYTDTENFARGGCLKVTKIKTNGEQVLCNTCSVSAATSLVCNLNATTGQIVAEGMINASNNSTITTHTLSKVLSTGLGTFGNFGPFLAFMIFLVLTFVGAATNSISATLVLGIFGVAIPVALGVYSVSIGAVFGMAGAAFLIMIKSRSD